MGIETWYGTNYFGMHFDGLIIEIGRRKWQLRRKIHEKCWGGGVEAVAVYLAVELHRKKCSDVAGSGTSSLVIIKLTMQIDFSYSHPGPSPVPWSDVRDEKTALKILTDAGCRHTPRLIATRLVQQSKEMPIPGAYLAIIVEQLLPGITYDRARRRAGADERKEMAEGLHTAIKAVWDLGIYQQDERPDNALWDATTKTCYIIDFEMWMPVPDYFTWHDSIPWQVYDLPPPTNPLPSNGGKVQVETTIGTKRTRDQMYFYPSRLNPTRSIYYRQAKHESWEKWIEAAKIFDDIRYIRKYDWGVGG